MDGDRVVDNSGYVASQNSGIPKTDKSKAIRQLNLENMGEEGQEKSQIRRSSVLERLEQKLKSPSKIKEFSEFKSGGKTNVKGQETSEKDSRVPSKISSATASDSQKNPESTDKNVNLLERPSTPSGGSPRIQEGLIKKLEPSKEKGMLGELKMVAKIHKRKASNDGPTPMKATGNDSPLKPGEHLAEGRRASVGERPRISRENSGEYQLKRPASRTSSNESLSGSGSGSKSAIEKIIDSRSSSNENVSDEKNSKKASPKIRQRHSSGGSSDRCSATETLTDADTGEDPLSSGLKRRGTFTKKPASKRTESGSETDENYSPTSTKDKDPVNVKERSPSPSSFVRRGSYRRKRTTSGGSEESENMREILPDKHDMYPPNRRRSNESQDDKGRPGTGIPRSQESSPRGSNLPVRDRPWARRETSDSEPESPSNTLNKRAGSQPNLSRVGSQSELSAPKSKIPTKGKIIKSSSASEVTIKERSPSPGPQKRSPSPGPTKRSPSPGPQESPVAMARNVRGRLSERVKVAKKEVKTEKRASSVGAIENRADAAVVAEKPPLAKPLGKPEGKSGKESQKSSRSASKEELIKRLVFFS